MKESEGASLDRLLITETGFLTEFVNQHVQRPERPFCFILGAGASRSSGIPTGAEMAAVWLREIHELEDFDGRSLEEWAASEHLDIPGFSMAAAGAFYPQLYRRRYGDQDQAGYAFLEDQMEGKESSYGYSVLAYLLSETRHKIVVTTNFDNLVADALSIHSNRFPLVVDHDSLAQYASVELRRPLIAKIHGALGFAPKSMPADVAALPAIWNEALTAIMKRCTPVVLGYEGNDGSLMTFLNSLPSDVPDRVFWCVYPPRAVPRDCLANIPASVRTFVKERRGRFVPISGFDELMAKLLSRLREKQPIPDLYGRLKDRARRREQSYDEQQRKMFQSAAPAGASTPSETATAPAPGDEDRSLKRAVNAIAASRKEKPWWVWEQEAAVARDAAEREAIYASALKALPDNAELLGNYALFLDNAKSDAELVDRTYRQAIDANPRLANNLTNYASFCQTRYNDVSKAEELFKRALAADPDHEQTLVRYAWFLANVRQDGDGADPLFKRALAAYPNQAYLLGDYAAFLDNSKNADGAEEYYQRALAVNPNHANNLANYAKFIQDVRWDMDRAEELYKRALAADPTHRRNLTNYAWFLKSVRNDVHEAERLSKMLGALQGASG
ncbi:MAG TPA: SIR2 family protein [Polyangiaceae bacterium]